ncbi:MAG: lipid-A-disaccharide synthase [Verrucomicrobiota bacterium]
MNRLFLVSGEISGDTHAAALLDALCERGEWKFSGLGGPLMQQRSEEIENWLDEAAVLGLWEVLKKYRYFREKLDETMARIMGERPEGVVLVDYPGFNLRLAAALRRSGYCGKIVYYISPQVWAWKKGRIRTMANLLDLMICIFPFEKELYESSGLPTKFAGHPLVEEMGRMKEEGIERETGLVALLPGSREREVEKLFPPMLGAAKQLLAQEPGLRFVTSGATAALTERLEALVNESGLQDVFSVGEHSSREIMQRATVGAVASGTATLEAACLALPYCLVYKVAWLTAFAARRVMSVPFLGIVNVIADDEVVRELLQNEATAESIARELGRLLNDSSARNALQSELADVVNRLGGGGAHGNAAEAISEIIESHAS